MTSSTLICYEGRLQTLCLVSGRSRRDLSQQITRRSRRSITYWILDYPVVIDVYSSGSGRRTSSNLTANSTIRTTANLAILRIQWITFIRVTWTSRVTRVERSYLAFAHQGRYLLKGGGSVTARPLFIVYPDIYSIEYRVQSMVIERSTTTYSQRLGASLKRVVFVYLSSLLSYILLVILHPY